MAQIDFGGLPHHEVLKQIEILETKVFPTVKKYTQTYPGGQVK